MKWLSDALRENPDKNLFSLVQRRWDVAEYLDGQYYSTFYDRQKQRVDDGDSVYCGCGVGWEQVTPDKIHTLADQGRSLSDLDKLGCPPFP